ncbi:MAG: DUF3347 domain-containing protein [Aquabacterium sp.]|nr:DUF3347 domain-containing protein [Ferruginibacter sp.]
MKTIMISLVIAAVTFTACNNKSGPVKETTKLTDTAATNTPVITATVKASPVAAVVTNYLQLKNALASDNAREAATAGKAVSESILQIDSATLTAGQKKVYDELKDDIKEHGEHIANNGDKIEHQREHFDMMSKDVYDLVKVFGSGQTLYKVHCPMYNEGKGADWLSEVKEIKNPYLGKKMPTCGTVKEEIKN